MTSQHQDLFEKAQEILKERGFGENEIYRSFWFKQYRIDVVGWSPRKKVAVEFGPCSQGQIQDLERFFDEVICLPFKPSVRPVPRQVSTSKSLANMRLMLSKDGSVLFEIPLSREAWPKEVLDDEMSSVDKDFQRFSKLFDALSHTNRLRMMKHMLEEEKVTVRFAEFIRELDLNPKLVWENTRKLRESGLIEKSDNGKYRCSPFGEASFTVLNLVLRRLEEIFESTNGGENG